MKNQKKLNLIPTENIVKLRQLAENYWASLKSKSIENIDNNQYLRQKK